jgi:hypothetical protein
MSEFVDSPLQGSDFQKNGAIPEGSPGVYDKDPCAEFAAYPRTKSGNAVREKFYEESMPKPSGESDMF